MWRHRLGAAGIVVALGLAAAAGHGAGAAPSAGVTSDGVVLLRGWPGAGQATSEPMHPWELELRADVIALGTVGRHFESDGRKLLRLTLGEVLKGEAELGAVFPRDVAPWFGCIPPPRPDVPSRRLAPGTDVLIYLHQDDAGEFSILSIGDVPEWTDGIRQFLRLHARIHSADPPWAEILDPRPFGVDELTFYAFGAPPPVAAAAPVLAKLEQVVARLEAGEALAAKGAQELSSLLALVNQLAFVDPSRMKTSLPPWARLIDWHCDQERALALYTDRLLPGRQLLATMDASDAPGWAERLERLLDWTGRVGGSAYQGTVWALSRLPGDAGLPALLSALDDHRPEVVNPLIQWSSRTSDADLRRQLRVKTASLLDDPTLQGREHLTFRRHLENLSRALGPAPTAAPERGVRSTSARQS